MHNMATENLRGQMPSDRLHDTRYDVWVRREGGEVVIGATSFGLHQAGEVIGLAKTVVAVHAPVAFRLGCANEDVEKRPESINRDPCGDGWMARGEPLDRDNDVARLVDAAAPLLYALMAGALESVAQPRTLDLRVHARRGAGRCCLPWLPHGAARPRFGRPPAHPGVLGDDRCHGLRDARPRRGMEHPGFFWISLSLPPRESRPAP